VVTTFSEINLYDYRIGLPAGGQWAEIFNSDVYDNWVNPIVAGNGGGCSPQAILFTGSATRLPLRCRPTTYSSSRTDRR
jgi:1,4-alpha-glucan branching enzyme